MVGWEKTVVAVLLLLCVGGSHGSRASSAALPQKLVAQAVEQLDVNHPPRPPVWPSSYEVSYTLDCPYVDTYQGASGSTNVHIWRDEAHGKGAQKIVRQDTEVTLELVDTDDRFYIFPFYEFHGCFADKIGADGGPTRRLNQWGDGGLSPALPNLAQPRWVFNATVKENDGTKLDVWRWYVPENTETGVRSMEYKMYTSAKDGAPVRLETWGFNYFSGGHWDNYIATFYDYKPGPVDASVFEVPEVCADTTNENPAHFGYDFDIDTFKKTHEMLGPVAPSAFFGDDEYDAFAHNHGRKHRSAEEYEARKAAYYAAKEEVAAINTDASAGFTAALNRFADWTEGEHASKGVHRSDASREKIIPSDEHWKDNFPKPPVEGVKYERALNDHELPAEVDWRHSGVDGPVKDQNYCGSCWAFSANGPIEAAYYRTYGEAVMLSEQQHMNCDWKYGARGCFGGVQEHAFALAMIDGMTTAEALPYTSANGVCAADVDAKDAPPAILKVKSYVDVSGGPEAIKEALLLKGPLAVNIDYIPSLKWYQSGIYNDPKCKTAQEDTNHAVILVGYGVEDGVEFWHVKNIWGPYWGEEGYLRITMAPANDCGVGSGAQFVELDEEETDRLREEYAAWKARQAEQ